MVYANLHLAGARMRARWFERHRHYRHLLITAAPPMRGLRLRRASYSIADCGRTLCYLAPRPSKFPYTDAITYFARALGAARSGDLAAADKGVQELARIVDALKTAEVDYWATEVEVQRLSAAAWSAQAKGNRAKGSRLMRTAADMEDKSEKAAVTPGRLVPARELLGEMLLE